MAKNKKLGALGGENSSPLAKGSIEIWFEIQKEDSHYLGSDDLGASGRTTQLSEFGPAPRIASLRPSE